MMRAILFLDLRRKGQIILIMRFLIDLKKESAR